MEGDQNEILTVLREILAQIGQPSKKWLTPEEAGLAFDELSTARKLWLLQTGARYIWTADRVLEARQILYRNLKSIIADPDQYVVDRIAGRIDKYINQFNLFNSQRIFNL